MGKELDECDAVADVHPDGVLYCSAVAGHTGMHRGSVWWLPLTTAPSAEMPLRAESFADRLARQSDDAAEAKWGVRPNGTVRISPDSGREADQ